MRSTDYPLPDRQRITRKISQSYHYDHGTQLIHYPQFSAPRERGKQIRMSRGSLLVSQCQRRPLTVTIALRSIRDRRHASCRHAVPCNGRRTPTPRSFQGGAPNPEPADLEDHGRRLEGYEHPGHPEPRLLLLILIRPPHGSPLPAARGAVLDVPRMGEGGSQDAA